MSSTTVTLNYGTSLSSGGDSGYRLANGTTANSTRGDLNITSSYVYRVTSVSVPLFGYSAASSNISISGTITVTIGSYKLTGTLSSTTLYTNKNVYPTVNCTGEAFCTGSQLYYLWVECSGSNLLKSGTRLATKNKSVTVTYYSTQTPVYYNAGTAWLPQTGQVGGTAKSGYTLVNALGHTHFAANSSGTVIIEYGHYGNTAFNAYNTTTLYNPPAGYRHAAEASQLKIWNYTKGSWINSTGASAASLNFRNFSPFDWGNTLVFFSNWLINTLTVNYHANGGNFDTQSGTTRYRVSSNLVQQSTNSGSSWTTLSTTGNINSNVDCHNVTTSGYGGGLKRAGYHVDAGAEFNTKSDGTGVNVNQDNGSTNPPTVYRINGNANLTDNKTITLYVNWKPNTYTVMFNRNGGPANGSGSVTATYNAAMPSATMPTRAGYTFDGYYDAASGGTQYYTSAGASARAWNKTANTTLYAHWTKNSYNLTLNLNKTNISGITEVDVIDAYYKILPSKTVGSPSNDISNWSKFRLSQNAWLAQHKDGYFASGNNNISRYSYGDWSDWDTSSTVTRIAKQLDNPFSNAAYEIQVDVRTPERAPDDFDGQAGGPYAGWVQTTQSAANLSFQHIFVAKIPIGSKIGWASNATGDGRSVTWLTSREGTGEYQVYAYQHNCGASGTFNTFGFIYIITDVTTVQSIYIAYSEVFNVTQSQVFSVPYNTVTSSLPIPVRPGYKFIGWGRSFNGSQQGMFGRDMYYTDKICIHFKAYMDDWQLYGSTPMRMISCTEGGGWNIEPSASGDSYQFNFLFWDAGASGYKSTLSNTLMSDLAPGWHIFDIIFDGTNVKGYIDGVLEGTSAIFSGAIGYNSTNGLFVGCESVSTETTGGTPYFTGYMTSPLIWHGTSIQGENNTQITMPAGGWTLKAYWMRANHINVFHNGVWEDVPINIYHNGEWQPSVIQTYHNGTWEET